MKRVLIIVAALALGIGGFAFQGEKEKKQESKPEPSRERRSEPRSAPSRPAPAQNRAPEQRSQPDRGRSNPEPRYQPSQDARKSSPNYDRSPRPSRDPSPMPSEPRTRPTDQGRNYPGYDTAPRPSRDPSTRPSRDPSSAPAAQPVGGRNWGQGSKDPNSTPKPVEQGNKNPSPTPRPVQQSDPRPKPIGQSDPRPTPTQGSKDPRPMPAQGTGGTSLGRKPRTSDGPGYQPRTGGIKPFEGPTHNRGNDPGLKKAPPTIPMPAQYIGRGSRDDHRGSFRFQIGRMEDYRIGLRSGYCHSDPFWCDWNFGYRFYYFDPRANDCVFSPYYGYYSVPGYLSYLRVRIGSFSLCVPIGDPIGYTYCGRGYYGGGYGYGNYNNYYSSNYDNSRYSTLDRALSDLTDAFKYQDPKLLDRVAPRNGSVEVFVDGDYAYTVDANDYYDITSDLINSVQTVDFRIEQVRRTRGNERIVVARHDYRDTWNAVQTSWLTFTLREDRGYWVITQAGTSRFRP